MLTADLVRVRRKGNRLELAGLSDAARTRMLQYAEDLIELADAHCGMPRCDFEEARDTLEIRPTDRKIALGLSKIVEDRCTFSSPQGLDPIVVRAALFAAAAHVRVSGLEFNRSEIIKAVAAALETTCDGIEQALFADLRQAELLTAFQRCSPQALLEQYQIQQAQALLLRATKLDVELECSDPAQARAFFRKLKFCRLLFEIESLNDHGRYRLKIDGPFGLFQASTKYGLQLALLLPWLKLCKRWRYTAEVRFGKDNTPLCFEQEGQATQTLRGEDSPLPDDVQALLESFQRLDSGWLCKRAEQIFHLPGRDVVVPDLAFHHPETNCTVYLEVMGYWSRDAVWKRIEMVQAGLKVPFIFAVSERLRVSPKALDQEAPSRLYVYKGVMNAKGILERLEALRPHPEGDVKTKPSQTPLFTLQ